MEKKENKKVILLVGIALSVLIVLVFSATYAYFSVSTSNSFGSTTIDATAETVGSVILNGTNASLRLNLSGADMMQGEDDIIYWATSDGTPSTTQNVVTIGSTQVTGAGYFNCNYTLSANATGTNNMYTAFQSMSGKSTEQIVLKIGDTKYDFNTASLFPITINGTLNGITSSSVKSLTAEFYLVNKEGVIQDALQGTDISINISVTNFSCTAVDEPTYTYYNTDSSEAVNSPNSSWNYYIKTNEVENQVCGVFNSEVCLKPNSWANSEINKTEMEAAGASCTYKDWNNNVQSSKPTEGYLNCILGSVNCDVYDNGGVLCGSGQSGVCGVDASGSASCLSSSGGGD